MTSDDRCECAARYGRPWHHRDCPARTPEEHLREAVSEACKKLTTLATDKEIVSNYIERRITEIVRTLRDAL